MSKLEDREGITGKECTKCSAWKALYAYAKGKNYLGGHKSQCKSCETEYSEANKDRRAEIARKWREVNKDRKAEHTRKYYEANKDRKAETNRNWRKNNPDKIALKDSRRRARKSSLPDDFTAEQQAEVLAYFNGGCALTGDTDNIHWDHVVPLSTGHGGTTYGNMIPLRSDLNASKNDANIFEWFYANKWRFNIPQERFSELFKYLADVNGLAIEDYVTYVYRCCEKGESE